VLRKVWRYYTQPYHRKLLPISVGVGVYFYLLLQRYHPFAIFPEIREAKDIQGFVDWVMSVLTYRPLLTFLGLWTLFGFLLFFWLFFFAQFTLPVHGWKERKGIFLRLWYYAIGMHGPALFVQDGHVIENKGERFKKGPGVIVLDSASAAVLKNEANFTRAVGPGVVFTAAGETIPKGAAIDLRKRSKSLGPYPDEDPFAPQGADEKDEAYRERQQRRWETSGKTQDGTEVVARLLVVFALDKHPDDIPETVYQQQKFRTDFNGHGVSAWRAIAHRPIEAEKDAGSHLEDRLLSWHWLPARLAADLWREYLQLFKLSDLFSEVRDGQSALDIINAAVKERLTSPTYPEMVRDGRLTGQRLTSREYALLQARGIRVITFLITGVFLPPAVEEGLISRWVANWKARAEREREVVEQKRLLAKKRGESAAAEMWGSLIADDVCQQAASDGLSAAECLERLLYALSHAIQTDPLLYQAQQPEFNSLKMLWAWAHDFAHEQQPSEEQV